MLTIRDASQRIANFFTPQPEDTTGKLALDAYEAWQVTLFSAATLYTIAGSPFSKTSNLISSTAFYIFRGLTQPISMETIASGMMNTLYREHGVFFQRSQVIEMQGTARQIASHVSLGNLISNIVFALGLLGTVYGSITATKKTITLTIRIFSELRAEGIRSATQRYWTEFKAFVCECGKGLNSNRRQYELLKEVVASIACALIFSGIVYLTRDLPTLIELFHATVPTQSLQVSCAFTSLAKSIGFLSGLGRIFAVTVAVESSWRLISGQIYRRSLPSGQPTPPAQGAAPLLNPPLLET